MTSHYLILLSFLFISLFLQAEELSSNNTDHKFEFSYNTQRSSDRYTQNSMGVRYLLNPTSDLSLILYTSRYKSLLTHRGSDLSFSFPSFENQQTSLTVGANRANDSLYSIHLGMRHSFYFQSFSDYWGPSELAFPIDFAQHKDSISKLNLRQNSFGISWSQEIFSHFDYYIAYTKFNVNQRNLSSLQNLYLNSMERAQYFHLESLLDHVIDLSLGWQFLESQRLSLSATSMTPYNSQNLIQTLYSLGLDSQFSSHWSTGFSLSILYSKEELPSRYFGFSLFYNP